MGSRGGTLEGVVVVLKTQGSSGKEIEINIKNDYECERRS